MDDLKIEGEIAKVDTDKRQVFGWASVTEINGKPVVDLQNDVLETYELEKAAYDYVLNSRVGGEMHRRVGKSSPKQVGSLIESMVITPEKIEKMGLPPDTPRGWWIGFKVQDEEVWQNVKKGKYAGFSIHGLGKRLEKSLDEIGKRTITIPQYTKRDGTVVEEHQRKINQIAAVDRSAVAESAISGAVAAAAGAIGSSYLRAGKTPIAAAYGAYALMMLGNAVLKGKQSVKLYEVDAHGDIIPPSLLRGVEKSKFPDDDADFDTQIKYFADSVGAEPEEFLERLGEFVDGLDEFTVDDFETFLESYEVAKHLLGRHDQDDHDPTKKKSHKRSQHTGIQARRAGARQWTREARRANDKELEGLTRELRRDLSQVWRGRMSTSEFDQKVNRELVPAAAKLEKRGDDVEEVSKETITVEEYTRRDGTVVPRHERKQRARSAVIGATVAVGGAGLGATAAEIGRTLAEIGGQSRSEGALRTAGAVPRSRAQIIGALAGGGAATGLMVNEAMNRKRKKKDEEELKKSGTKIEFLVSKAYEYADSEAELVENLADIADEVEKLFIAKSDDKEEVSKETVIVEQYTRSDGTVVPRHERKVSRRAAAALAGAAGVAVAASPLGRGFRAGTRFGMAGYRPGLSQFAGRGADIAAGMAAGTGIRAGVQGARAAGRATGEAGRHVGDVGRRAAQNVRWAPENMRVGYSFGRRYGTRGMRTGDGVVVDAGQAAGAGVRNLQQGARAAGEGAQRALSTNAQFTAAHPLGSAAATIGVGSTAGLIGRDVGRQVSPRYDQWYNEQENKQFGRRQQRRTKKSLSSYDYEVLEKYLGRNLDD